MHNSESLSAEVRDAGAQGCVLKSQAARDLVLAIETVLGGGTFFRVSEYPEPRKEKKPNRGMFFRKAFGYG